jgi:hypothetical protein
MMFKTLVVLLPVRTSAMRRKMTDRAKPFRRSDMHYIALDVKIHHSAKGFDRMIGELFR